MNETDYAAALAAILPQQQDTIARHTLADGQTVWVRKTGKTIAAWRYRLLGAIASLLRLGVLRPVPNFGGRTALDTEAQRLATLTAAGVRVPRLLARNADALMFSHLGDTDILDAIKIAADPVACWQRGLDAIAAVHQRDQYLSQAFGRNIIACDDGETGFIDFEDDPGRYLPLAHCQSRDYLCYLQSSAFWLRENGLLPAAAAVWRRHRALPAAAAVGKTVRPILWMRRLNHPRWGSATLRLEELDELVFLAGR